MSTTPDDPLRERLLKELWEELDSLEGEALQEFLTSAGLNPADLVQAYDAKVQIAEIFHKRERFELARKRVHAAQTVQHFRVSNFDLSRKKGIMESIKQVAAKTREMTIAARNEKINSETDVDAFLEACVRLGLIDQDGNILK